MRRACLLTVILFPAILCADLVIYVRDKTGQVIITVTVPNGVSADVHPSVSPSPPPLPTDSFAGKLQAAYTADTATDKAKNIKLYATVWRRAGVGTADYMAPIANPLNGTLGAVMAAVSEDSANILPKTTLPSVRRVVGDEINAKVGNDPSMVLTNDLRTKIAAEFVRIAQAIEGVK